MSMGLGSDPRREENNRFLQTGVRSNDGSARGFDSQLRFIQKGVRTRQITYTTHGSGNIASIGGNIGADNGATGAITDAWVVYQPAVGGGWVRATSIPVGAPIQITCALNAHQGSGTKWACCVTVIEVTPGIALASRVQNYWYHSTATDYVGVGTADISLDNASCTILGNNVMPNYDLVLAFHMFASPDSSPTAPTAAMYYNVTSGDLK